VLLNASTWMSPEMFLNNDNFYSQSYPGQIYLQIESNFNPMVFKFRQNLSKLLYSVKKTIHDFSAVWKLISSKIKYNRTKIVKTVRA
jgi:hypothetical protein